MEIRKEELVNAESKVSFKLETNSRSTNVTTHIYEGADKTTIDKVWNLALEAHKKAVKEASGVTQ